jgi:DNA polymerase phi
VRSIQRKQKIIDLLDVFAKHQPSSNLILDIAVSLFSLVTRSGEPEVIPKATRVLRAIVVREPQSGLDREAALAALDKIHKTARSDLSSENAALCDQFSLFLSRFLLPESASDVVSAYAATLDDLLTRNGSRVPPALLNNFVKRYPSDAWALRERLLESLSVGSNVRAFRRMQAMTVLNVLLTSLANSVSEHDL